MVGTFNYVVMFNRLQQQWPMVGKNKAKVNHFPEIIVLRHSLKLTIGGISNKGGN